MDLEYHSRRNVRMALTFTGSREYKMVGSMVANMHEQSTNNTFLKSTPTYVDDSPPTVQDTRLHLFTEDLSSGENHSLVKCTILDGLKFLTSTKCGLHKPSHSVTCLEIC